MIDAMNLPAWEFDWDLVSKANNGEMPFVFPWIQTDDPTINAYMNFQNQNATEPFCINQQLGTRTQLTRGYDVLCPLFRIKYTIDQLVYALNNKNTIHANSISDDDCILNNNLIFQEGGNFFFIHPKKWDANTPTSYIELQFPKFVNEFDPEDPQKPFFFQKDFRLEVGDKIQFPVAFTGGTSTYSFYDIEYTAVASDINSDGSLDLLQFPINLTLHMQTIEPAFTFDILRHFERYLVIRVNNCAEIPEVYKKPFFIIGKDFSYTYKPIELKNHLPKQSAFDVLNTIRNYFNLVFTPDYINDVIYVFSKNNLLNSHLFKDYTEQLLEFGYTIFEPENKMKFIYSRENKDELSKEINIIYNEDGDFGEVSDMQINANVPMTDLRNQDDGTNSQNVKIIKVNQLFEPIAINKRDFILQFCKYLGVVSLNNAEKITSADTFEIGPENVFRKEWLSWYTSFKNGREIRVVPMNLNANDIQGLNPEYKWKLGNQMYIWKEITTPITMAHGIEPSEVKLVKVNFSISCDTGILQIEEIENEEGEEG